MIRIGGQPREQLIVDLAPAPAPADAKVRAWAADQCVFVSSVMGGMTAEREAVVRAITTVGAQPAWFEAFGGMDDDPEDAYTAQVASSDIYLGILGASHGKPLKTGYSPTQTTPNTTRQPPVARGSASGRPARTKTGASRIFSARSGSFTPPALIRRLTTWPNASRGGSVPWPRTLSPSGSRSAGIVDQQRWIMRKPECAGTARSHRGDRLLSRHVSEVSWSKSQEEIRQGESACYQG
jgi:Domain of unknown function (DUF4062)